jgi:hypothetical protein
VGDQISLTIVNQGICSLSGFTISLFLSSDPVITVDDMVLTFGTFSITNELGVGEEYTCTINPYIKIPTGAAPTSYYLGPLLDRNNDIWELDEDNNDVSCPIHISPTYPVTDIEANGSDIAVIVNQGDTVTIDVELLPNNGSGVNADWWILADTAMGWYRYNMGSSSWVKGLAPAFQGPLNSVGPMMIFNASILPRGTFTFYFGVDLNKNGSPTMNQMYYDSIDVKVE